MSTSGSFVPAVIPECPYAPRMTRAAALALRAAGELKENCVVVLHTDTPVIGTAGNTSPTEIELNPVSPTEFGTTARVHTTFAASAWPGVYDIDLGTAGSIVELRDDFGNVGKDTDADSPTVHTQMPWHKGAGSFRDNQAEDATLTGWDTATGTISDNKITGATVDLTGLIGGSFTNNVVEQGGRVVVTDGGTAAVIQGNHVVKGFDLTVNAPGAAFTLVHNTMRGDSAATLTGDVTADLSITQTGGTVVIDTNDFVAEGTGTKWVIGQTAGTVTLQQNSFIGSIGTLAQPLNLLGSGDVTLQRNTSVNGRINTVATNTAPFSMSDSKHTNMKFRLNQTAGGVTIRSTEFVSTPTAGASPDFDVLGTGTVLLQSDRIVNDLGTLSPMFLLDGSGSWAMGDVQVTNSVDLANAPMRKTAASTGSVNIFGGAQFLDSQIVMNGSGSITGTGGLNLNGSTLTNNGASVVTLGGSTLTSSSVTASAAATRGLSVASVNTVGASIVQNGTGGAGVDSISSGVLQGTINLNNTAATAAGMTITRFTIAESSVLTVTDCVPLNAVDGGEIRHQSTVNLNPGGQLDQSRVAMGATLNAGHLFEQSILDMNAVRTTTANNLNRLANKSFDDLLAA